jgi:hypothetical protein
MQGLEAFNLYMNYAVKAVEAVAYLKMLSEVISEASKTNTSEEVDSISSVTRLILREHATVHTR